MSWGCSVDVPRRSQGSVLFCGFLGNGGSHDSESVKRGSVDGFSRVIFWRLRGLQIRCNRKNGCLGSFRGDVSLMVQGHEVGFQTLGCFHKGVVVKEVYSRPSAWLRNKSMGHGAASRGRKCGSLRTRFVRLPFALVELMLSRLQILARNFKEVEIGRAHV